MKQWEYYQATRKGEMSIDELNIYGARGWELCAVHNVTGTRIRGYYFKKEIFPSSL
jgi:hypothetical protein